MVKLDPIFADYNSTTPLCSDVLSAIQLWGGTVGNVSSSHQFGQHVSKIYDEASDAICTRLNAMSYELLTCSSATEANHWFFYSLLSDRVDIPRVIMSAIEHPCVSKALTQYSDQGVIDLKICRVMSNGMIDLDHFQSLLTPNTLLVSLILANNEIGTIQPLAELSRLAKGVGALVHSDIVQAAGKLPVDLHALGIDVAVMSSHKCYAPVGCGVLLVNDVHLMKPMLVGGTQQQQLRAGTVNALGLHLFSIGLDYCCRSSHVNVHEWAKQLCQSVSGLHVPIEFNERTQLWNSIPLAVEGYLAHDVMMRLDMNGVGVSTGSACSTGAIETSPVIQALRLPENVANSVIRLSFGYPTTPSQLDYISSILSSF